MHLYLMVDTTATKRDVDDAVAASGYWPETIAGNGTAEDYAKRHGVRFVPGMMAPRWDQVTAVVAVCSGPGSVIMKMAEESKGRQLPTYIYRTS